MAHNPIWTHRRKEGIAGGVVLLGVIIGVFTIFANTMAGFIILVLALAIGCAFYLC